MRWGSMRDSGNVEDQESTGPARGLGGGFKLGGVGLVAVLAISWFLGLNPLDVLRSLQGGDSSTQSAPAPSASAPGARDEIKEFIARVLGDTEDTWSAIFKKMGREYRPPKLVLFRGAVDSACGLASSAAGPFYCSPDDRVYLDRSFFEDLSKRFGAPGEFARAYVIAHEVGHHVQNQLGITGKVAQQRGRASEARSNALSVLVELQADCFAGIWGHYAQQRGLLDPGDVQAGLAAAAAIGDDRIQQQSGGRVSPESFTHGSSAQRVRWFRSGLDSGDVNQCNTFETARP
ncbi:MAG TPA: neutral zinc metallopeptidase [Methylomirabilota bacterium]|nr:neutral zinc metallopeptidase [Methylomirabilota bacterium]